MQPTEIREEGGLDRGAGGLARTGTGSPGGKESRGFRWQFLTCRLLPHKTPESKADPHPSQWVKLDLREHVGQQVLRITAWGPCVSCPNPCNPSRCFPTSNFLLLRHSLFVDPLSALTSMSSVTRNGSPASWAEQHVQDTHTPPRQRLLCLLNAFPSFQFCLQP